jgi:hypothetical protein
MLNLFNSFVVPDVKYVTVYHDDQDDHLFYMVPELPSIMQTAEGGPAFRLIAFARDFTLLANAASELPTGETEGGLVTMTTELRVNDEDQEKIRSYIQGGMGANPLLALRPRLAGNEIRFSALRAFSSPPRLSYPTWVDGSVSFNIFPGAGETFVKAKEGSEKPSLVTSNLASYSAVLGQEGVRLIRAAVEDGWSPGTVNYSVSFVARIPALTVTVTGNAKDAYEELKEYCTVYEHYQNGNTHTNWQYPAVSSLEQIREIFTSLHIEVDVGEFRGEAAADGGAAANAQEAMQNAALTIVQQLIKDRFLAPGFSPGVKPQLGNPLPHAPGPPNPDMTNNQFYLKEFTQEMGGEIDFTFTSRSNLTVTKNPNSQLFTLVDPEQIKNTIVEADLSKPYFHLLDVPVRVTANFDKDPIAAVKVFLDYDEKDDQTGEQKTQTAEFLFDSNDDVFYFRTVMARDADGRPKDSYDYRSQLIYKASAKSEEVPLKETRERSLIIGYDQLDCVQVTAQWGSIPVAAVQQVQVHFKYPGVSLPTAETDIFLRADAPEGTWFTYTEGKPSREYEFQTTFFMADGQKLQLPVEKGVAERLLINAPFEDKLRATFVPQGSFPPVASIVLSVRYQDPENSYDVSDVHTFTGPAETWLWEVDLADKAKREFEYKVDVTFADGSSESRDWQKAGEGTVLVGDVARQMLNVEVVPTLVDLTKWKLVIVRLRYADPANEVALDHTIQLTSAGVTDPALLKWTIPLKDGAVKKYSYEIQAFGQDGTTKHAVPLTETEDPLLVLEF